MRIATKPIGGCLICCYFFSLRCPNQISIAVMRCPNQISIAVNKPAAIAALKLKVILMTKGNQALGICRVESAKSSGGFKKLSFLSVGIAIEAKIEPTASQAPRMPTVSWKVRSR